jgi:hypothetical protein
VLRLSPAPTLRRPATVARHPLGAAATLGAVLAMGFLVLTLSGAPVLGWSLLATAAAVAMVDTVLIAAGRQSPGILERLFPRRPCDA